MKKPLIFLLHFVYWLGYLLLAMMMTYVLQTEVGPSAQLDEEVMAMAFLFMVMLPAIVTFYFFYLILFPRYFRKKQYALALGLGAMIALSTTLIGYALLAYGLYPECATEANDQEGLVFFGISSAMSFGGGVVGLVIKGFSTWFDEVALKEQLQEKTHEMEMALVKSQLAPHFLFNTINNIDAMILTNAEEASDYLNRLSDIMRFMLYEAKAPKIPLQQELAYLEKYVALQRIRTANESYAQFIIEGDPIGRSIAPMLFIPFVENAFKHTPNKKTPGAIRLSIRITPGSIRFFCTNKIGEEMAWDFSVGGLGNELIRKRLELIYPETHQLDVRQIEGEYRVELRVYDQSVG